MNIGQTALNLFQQNAIPIVLIACIVSGLYLLFKKQITGLVAWAFISIIGIGLVFNPDGAAQFFLKIFNLFVR